MTAENSLVIFTQAAHMLAKADTIQKAKELKDLALTAADWAKRKGMGQEAVKYCHSYATRAEIRLGEMLAETERAKGTQPSKTHGGHMELPPSDTPTLSELGITKRESSEAQMLAELDSEEKEEVIAGKKNKTQVRREKREQKREERREQNKQKAKECPDILSIDAKFATILIDPPWDVSDEGDINQLGRAKADYTTMPYEELLKLPVGNFADIDCHIYCWVTNRSMPKVFSLLEAWGFRYITLLTWPKPSFGMGNYFRGQTEHVAFGIKGSQQLKRKNASTLLESWQRGKRHSEKPVEFYDFIESCSPGPYIEIFGRTEQQGWSIWGADAK